MAKLPSDAGRSLCAAVGTARLRATLATQAGCPPGTAPVPGGAAITKPKLRCCGTGTRWAVAAPAAAAAGSPWNVAVCGSCTGGVVVGAVVVGVSKPQPLVSPITGRGAAARGATNPKSLAAGCMTANPAGPAGCTMGLMCGPASPGGSTGTCGRSPPAGGGTGGCMLMSGVKPNPAAGAVAGRITGIVAAARGCSGPSKGEDSSDGDAAPAVWLVALASQPESWTPGGCCCCCCPGCVTATAGPAAAMGCCGSGLPLLLGMLDADEAAMVTGIGVSFEPPAVWVSLTLVTLALTGAFCLYLHLGVSCDYVVGVLQDTMVASS